MSTPSGAETTFPSGADETAPNCWLVNVVDFVQFHVLTFLFHVVMSATISRMKQCSARLDSRLFCRGFIVY